MENKLGINVIFDSSQEIRTLKFCLCMLVDVHVHAQEEKQILFEVIVNDYIEYFVYEIWIIEHPKSIKRFYKEKTIPLSEFRDNFFVNINSTHETIAEKYIKQELAILNKENTIDDIKDNLNH